MSRWFRFYDDAINDPKVLRMPEALRWHWIAVLCVASKNGGALPDVSDIALSLRLTEKKTGEILKDLLARGLLDEVGENGLAPHNWNGRQFKSDVSTERVKRFRNTPRNVPSDVSETPPDTEADTEQNRAESKTRARRAARTALPPDFKIEEYEYEYALSKGFSLSKATAMGEAFSNHHRANGSLMADWQAAWRKWCGNETKFKGKSDAKTGASLSETAGRLAGEGVTFGPRPSGILPAENAANVRLLETRRRDQPGDHGTGSGGGPLRISEGGN